MAQKINVSLVDDVDGTIAQETVKFSIDGVSHEIDLSADNAEKLRATFAPYVAAARRVGGRKVRSTPAPRVRAKAPTTELTAAAQPPATPAVPAAVFSAVAVPAAAKKTAAKKAVKRTSAPAAKKAAPKGAKKVGTRSAGASGRRPA